MLPSMGVELTTRSKQPWSKDNTNNDRVSSTSKSSCSKNKVSEHHRIFQYFANKKHTSCNDNVKDAKMNVCNDTTCATCEKCMVDNLHDVCVSKFLNDMNSCTKPQITNVSNNKNQKEQKAKIMTSKKLDMKSKSLATPSVNTPIIYRRWKETGRILDFVKISKLVPNTNVEKADQMILVCEKASTSNPLELRSIWNDHVDAVLGHGDLQWGKILIARAYYVKGLVHNLFSVRQFYDADLEDEAPETIITFIKKVQVRMQSIVRIVRINNGTEFTNQQLKAYFENVGITHQTLVVRTPQQNGAGVVATACFTQNYSIIHNRSNKKLYEIINGRKMLKAKGDIGFFIGSFKHGHGYWVYNRRTRRVMETMNVKFDELSAMASEQRNLMPALQQMASKTHNLEPTLNHQTSRHISSGL
ncbi:integrase, catalytic region, zinc finger, CCHC-type containing protein, partial [Tanacetum coccineum]